jgi:hypothetical protein
MEYDPEITCNYCGLTVYFNGTVPDMCLHCRDKFAMAALPAVIAALVHQREATTATQSSIAYQFADAMMEARKATGQSTAPATPKESR